MVVVLCCMHCTSTRPEQVLWTSLVAALRHLTDLDHANLLQRLTNGFCHRSARLSHSSLGEEFGSIPHSEARQGNWCVIWLVAQAPAAFRLNLLMWGRCRELLMGMLAGAYSRGGTRKFQRCLFCSIARRGPCGGSGTEFGCRRSLVMLDTQTIEATSGAPAAALALRNSGALLGDSVIDVFGFP